MGVTEKLLNYGLTELSQYDIEECICVVNEFCDFCIYEKEKLYDIKEVEQDNKHKSCCDELLKMWG